MLYKIIQVWWITKCGAEQWKSDQTEPWWRRRWSCPRETLLRDVAGKRGQQRRHPLLRWWWRRRGRKKTDPRSVPGRSPQEAGPADRAEPENLDHHEQQRLPHHGRPRQQASSTTCQGTHNFLPCVIWLFADCFDFLKLILLHISCPHRVLWSRSRPFWPEPWKKGRLRLQLYSLSSSYIGPHV